MDIFTIQVNLAQYKIGSFFFFRGGFWFSREGAVSNIYSLNMYLSLSNLFVMPE